ncbi:hypothetical protein Barb7_03053 [Bacteroidales bacterium Barb7]|nr:hypothetical protein Barb7_03053 [Bacteroidales bacterium Barb7]
MIGDAVACTQAYVFGQADTVFADAGNPVAPFQSGFFGRGIGEDVQHFGIVGARMFHAENDVFKAIDRRCFGQRLSGKRFPFDIGKYVTASVSILVAVFFR